MQHTRSLYRALFDTAPDAIAAVDRIGHIVVTNSRFDQLFGYPHDELFERPLAQLIPDVTWRTPSDVQVLARRKDGTEFPAEISLAVLDTTEGQVVAAAISDLSERHAAQAVANAGTAELAEMQGQMHQSQRLESLGQLTGGVAHDFNNLLGIILNYAAFVDEGLCVMAERYPDDDLTQLRTDMAQIRNSTDQAVRFTRQLLDFGRREVMHPELLHLNDVVRDVVEVLGHSIGEQVALTTTLAPDLNLVLVDRGQLEQVLMNLAVNARDAMPNGGTLEIETANVEVGTATARPELPPGLYVSLRVIDDGEGMGPDVLEHAFEAFFTTKPRGEGSGLGLATVGTIITRAGGFPHLASEPGRGTTFSALLPATHDLSDGVPVTISGNRRRGAETVLVVEDEDKTRELTRRILARNGYTVLTAPTAAAAIDTAMDYRAPIDLLLTDVIMPLMGGGELANVITGIRDTQVLFMSGYGLSVLAQRKLINKNVHFIEKPFTEAALLERVSAILKKTPT